MCGSTVAESEKLANPGVKLDVRRVGTKISYLEDANVGETIRFDYDGGSDPGGVRTVLVQSIEGEGVKGATLERDGAFRSYLDRNRIGPVEVVAPFTKDAEVSPVPQKAVAPAPVAAPAVVGGLVENRVRFDAAKLALLAALSAEQLAALYQQHVAKESKGVSYDASKGELVVKTEPPKPTFDTKKRTDYRFAIAKNGETVEFFIYADNRVGIDHRSKDGKMLYTSSRVTPEKLVEELNKLLA